MTNSFTLELDTTAPVVTFGPPSNTDAGETLTVPFLLSEPDTVTAQLQLADGRLVDGEISGGSVMVDLPLDTPEGLATLRLHVRDDVLNEADRVLVIPVTGVATRPPRTYPSPGESIPSLPALPEDTHHHVRSSQPVRTRTATTRGVRTSAARVGVHGRVGLAAHHVASGPLRIRTGAGVSRRGRAASTLVTVVTSHQLSRLREGPQTEAEIAAILGLL